MRNAGRGLCFILTVVSLGLPGGPSFGEAGGLKEVDIVIGPHAVIDSAVAHRAELESWGVRVNVYKCEGAAPLVSYLSGKEGKAPVVLLLCHGFMGSTRMAQGIVLFDENMQSGDRAKQPFQRTISPGDLEKVISLPGRTVICTGCFMGHPDIASAFLKGGVKAYMASRMDATAIPTAFFATRVLYDLAWNGATVEEAYERERHNDGESGEIRLYQSGWKRDAEPAVQTPRTIRAPAVIDDFSGENQVRYEYFPYYGPENWRWAVPAPGGKPGLAYRMPFNFAEETYPWLSAYPRRPQHWEEAKGIVLDVFARGGPGAVPESIFAFYVEGKGGRYTWDPVKVKAGWQEVRLPFDSGQWVFEKDGKKEKPGAFEPATIDPVTGYGMVLIGRGRKDSGNLFFANLRLM